MRVVVPPVSWHEALFDFAGPLQRVLNELNAPAGEVWFGAHFEHVHPPPEAVIFQTEVGGTRWFTSLYRQKLARARAVWDYSTVNRAAYDCREWFHVPLRFHESMVWTNWKREPSNVVGFFGSLNPRRLAYIKEATCMPVQFGIPRRAWLANVGSVVSAHYYNVPSPVEQARIGMLLANAIPVVAEHSPDEKDYPGPVYANGAELVRIAKTLTPFDGKIQHAAFRAKGTAHASVRAALGL